MLIILLLALNLLCFEDSPFQLLHVHTSLSHVRSELIEILDVLKLFLLLATLGVAIVWVDEAIYHSVELFGNRFLASARGPAVKHLRLLLPLQSDFRMMLLFCFVKALL